MTKTRKISIAILLCLMAVLLASGLFLMTGTRFAAAYDGLPGEFGGVVGEVISDESGKYVNYERGYVMYAADGDASDPTKAIAHVGGKNVKIEDGELVVELIPAERMTSVKNWDTLVDANSSGNRVAYGPGWNAEAAVKVGNAFKDKWTELISEGYNLGIPCSDVDLFVGGDDGNAVVFGMAFRYGDSIYEPDDGNGGRKNASYLMYNVLEDEVFVMSDGFARLTGELRRIGAPLSEQISGATVTGYDGEGNRVDVSGATVQLFETGVLIGTQTSGGRVTYAEKYEGVIEKISDTEYIIHPLINDQDILARDKGSKIMIEKNGEYFWLGFIGDVDGTWHALRTARLTREDGNIKVEYNFRAGCIEVVYSDDYYLLSRMAYAGQNFAYDEEGNSERVWLPTENFTTDEHLWEGVESNALEMYRKLSGNSGASEADMKADFRAEYMQLLSDGIIPGYRCSSIKIWDVLCVDYKYSPYSLYGFDSVGTAARERMFTLVYSGVQKRVYGVGDDIWNIWRDDSVRRALGAPISDVLYNVTISGQTFSRIQIFEQGYITENSAGALVVEYGVTTDGDYKQFIYKAAPADKPEQYGTQTGEFTTTEGGSRVVYLNYERGAVKATEMSAKVGYVYDYYPGRNFYEENGTYVARLLDYETLYNDGDFTCDASYAGIWEGGFDDEGNYVEGVKAKLIAKIQELLAQGFFPGFLERNFQAWNLVACQQFIFGDSTAMPWAGDSRTNVCAMIYNEELGEIFLLKDAFMELWGGTQAYTQLGAPAGEEFTIDGNDGVVFQYFYGTATQNNRAFAASVGYNEATYYCPSDSMLSSINPEQYLADFKALSRPLSGVEIVPPASTSVSVGSYTMLEYVIDGASADAQVSVVSSDENIAVVMADGSVEFKAAGTVTITVTVSDGANTFTDSVTFEVGGGRTGCAGITSDWSIFTGGALLLVAGGLIATGMIKRRRHC